MSQQINFLDRGETSKRFSFTSSTGIAAGVGAVVVLAAVYAVFESTRLARVEAQARAVTKSLADARAERGAAPGAGERKPDAALEAKLAELASELKARQDVLDALKRGSAGSTGGFSAYFRAFSRQRVEGVWLTGFEIAAGGAALTIAGRALNADLVPGYLQGLNREPPLQGRQFASIVINRPMTAEAPARADAKEAPARPALPPYLDFVISTEDKQGGKAKGS